MIVNPSPFFLILILTIHDIMKLAIILILTIGISQAHAGQRYKFRAWLPYYDYLWQRRAETCAPQIHRYHTNNRTGVHHAVCAAVVDCLLTNVTQSIQSNLASADILLGLTPQILSLAGPSRGELAILSTHEPIFTGFLSFGFPSILVTSLFGSVGVAEILGKPVAKTSRAYHSWLLQQSNGLQFCAKMMLYALAAGAVFNNIYTSVYLDARTASGWRCGANYMPLMWSISGCSITAMEAVAIRTRHFSSQKVGQRTKQACGGVCDISSRQIHGCILPHAQDTCYTEILFGVASVMSVVQSIFGTVVLSSLLFVSFLDALPILVRYQASAAVCNLLLRLELAGLKCNLEREGHSGGKDQTRHFQLVERNTGWDLELVRTII